jgi:hypothetical protein
MNGKSDPILSYVVAATRSFTGSAPGRNLLANVEMSIGAIDQPAPQPGKDSTVADRERGAFHQADEVGEIPEVEVTR